MYRDVKFLERLHHLLNQMTENMVVLTVFVREFSELMCLHFASYHCFVLVVSFSFYIKVILKTNLHLFYL